MLDSSTRGVVLHPSVCTLYKMYYIATPHQHMQLADFLRVPLERAGGMMTLPDVYCLFNRARGTELISPDDLLQVMLKRPCLKPCTTAAWHAHEGIAHVGTLVDVTIHHAGNKALGEGGGTPGAAGVC
jgi:EAP30/Vps36 family